MSEPDSTVIENVRAQRAAMNERLTAIAESDAAATTQIGQTIAAQTNALWDAIESIAARVDRLSL